jgi:hypothetical protein
MLKFSIVVVTYFSDGTVAASEPLPGPTAARILAGIIRTNATRKNPVYQQCFLSSNQQMVWSNAAGLTNHPGERRTFQDWYRIEREANAEMLRGHGSKPQQPKFTPIRVTRSDAGGELWVVGYIADLIEKEGEVVSYSREAIAARCAVLNARIGGAA